MHPHRHPGAPLSVPGADPKTVIGILDLLDSETSASYVTAASVVIDFDRLPTGNPEFCWNQAAVPGTSASVRLYNATDALVMGELTGITTTGLKKISITIPSGMKLVVLQHLRAAGGGGGSSNIEGGAIHLG